MDQKTLFIQWTVTCLVRLFAGAVIGYLGKNAYEYGTTIDGFASAASGAVIAGISLYTSLKGRHELLTTPAPDKTEIKP